MAESFLDLLRQRFPQAEALAVQRIFARRTIFFNTKNKTVLPGFTNDLVFAALLFALVYIREIGWTLELTETEKEFFGTYKVNPIRPRQ